MCKLKKLKEIHMGETAIVKIPQCIGYLKKLEVLYATGCKSLDGLPNSMSHMVNLLTLDLRFCPKLCKLLESIGSLVKLERLSCGFNNSHDLVTDYSKSLRLGKLISSDADAGICELPESIGDLKNLKFLHIGFSKKLSNLPNTINKLGNLEELDAMYCKSLGGEIHIDGLSSLKFLCLEGTGVFGFHGAFDKLSRLEKLELLDCHMLQSLPELLASLTVLEVTGQHRTFPQLSHLIHLKKLPVKECPLLESMPELPSGLLEFSVNGCGELKELPSLSNLKFLSDLRLESCGELTKIRGLEGLKSLELLLVENCQKLSNLDGLEHLQSLRILHLIGPTILNDDQFAGLEKLNNLESLEVVDCESLVRVDVPQSTHLGHLSFCGCHQLLEIKGLEGLQNLGLLKVVGCPSITLPDLSCFTNLHAFVDECSNIPDGRGVTKAKYCGRGSYRYWPRRDPMNPFNNPLRWSKTRYSSSLSPSHPTLRPQSPISLFQS
ncbi:hypothetical protein ACJRO7_018866 [Eucalyptus globulus]|uniref:Leucine-rich repeat domain, L domain-containing protein n=1 Tax=Eucalyptus globulus TaxID=34317 RepID=A0ABD3KVA2_EUCGL